MALSLTLITCTYNRADTLQRLYLSIQQQKLLPHEWIVIDDGSTDSTASIISLISASSQFPVVYRYQSNRGKHIAWNLALTLSTGQFIMGIDSDNMLSKESLAYLNDLISQYPDSSQAPIIRSPTAPMINTYRTSSSFSGSSPLAGNANWLTEWWSTYRHMEYVDCFPARCIPYLFMPPITGIRWFPEITAYASLASADIPFFYISDMLQIYDNTPSPKRLSQSSNTFRSLLGKTSSSHILIVAAARLLVIAQTPRSTLSKHFIVYFLNTSYVISAVCCSFASVCMRKLSIFSANDSNP